MIPNRTLHVEPEPQSLFCREGWCQHINVHPPQACLFFFYKYPKWTLNCGFFFFV